MKMQIRIISAEFTGDASKDDPLNQDNIGDNEILVVTFGTSFDTVSRIRWCEKSRSQQEVGLGRGEGHFRTLRGF